METPFAVADLVLKLKSKGLDIAEEGALILESSLIEWISESVALTPNPLDNLAIPVLAALKPLLEAQIDKIDGKQG